MPSRKEEAPTLTCTAQSVKYWHCGLQNTTVMYYTTKSSNTRVYNCMRNAAEMPLPMQQSTKTE